MLILKARVGYNLTGIMGTLYPVEKIQTRMRERAYPRTPETLDNTPGGTFLSHLCDETARTTLDANPHLAAPDAREVFSHLPIRDQWKTRQYAEVPNSVERAQVEGAVELLREVDTLDQETKDGLCIAGENGRGKGSLGFVERKPESDGDREHKFYFHYNPAAEALLEEKIQALGETEQGAVRALIAEMRAMWLTMEERAYETVQQIEAENEGNPHYAGYTDRFFPDGLTRGDTSKQVPKLVLRLMVYRKVEPGALSAKNHYDGGALTFAVCESAPGLQVGTKHDTRDPETGELLERTEDMTEVSRPDGTALVWPSGTHVRIDPESEPVWHGVTQHTSDEVALGQENRWALVAFLDEYDEAPLSAEQTHGEKPL